MPDKKSKSLRPEKISSDLSRFQLRRCSDDIPKFPPYGEWVSKKGVKSYVYELVFSGQETEPDK